MNAWANPEYYALAKNTTYWTEIQNPQLNPETYMNQTVGMWQCLVILAALTIALRILSFIFLKLLVSKFQ